MKDLLKCSRQQNSNFVEIEKRLIKETLDPDGTLGETNSLGDVR
jgi:hypothetical protein